MAPVSSAIVSTRVPLLVSLNVLPLSAAALAVTPFRRMESLSPKPDTLPLNVAGASSSNSPKFASKATLPDIPDRRSRMVSAVLSNPPWIRKPPLPW